MEVGHIEVTPDRLTDAGGNWQQLIEQADQAVANLRSSRDVDTGNVYVNQVLGEVLSDMSQVLDGLVARLQNESSLLTDAGSSYRVADHEGGRS